MRFRPNVTIPRRALAAVSLSIALVCGLSAAAPASAGRTKRVVIAGGLRSCLTPLRTILTSRGTPQPRNMWVQVDKSDRVLRLMSGPTVIKTYLISLGGSPDVRKTRRGDRATPEGTYYVCQKLPQSRFYLSLKLSYPNAEDAARGLKSGLIDRATYNKIAAAIKRKGIPPMNTALGGDICIHGDGKVQPGKSGSVQYADVEDWTAGCMALRQPDIKELFSLLPVGTMVRISP